MSEMTDAPGAMAQYPSVFRPFRIGNVEVGNRIFIPAHTTNFAEDFLPTETHLAYHRERARGGVGLIIIEPLRVHRTSLGRSGGLTGADRDALPGLRRITETIRAEGVPVFVQLTHAGRHNENAVDRTAPWGPDNQPWTISGEVPHPMTIPEIHEVIASYRDAVDLAVEAGFMGFEIHFGHGHLLHQFLSPASNRRTDEYGGSLENRMRFPLAVLQAVIEQNRGRMAVGVRVSVDELMTGGLDAEESLDIIHRAALVPGIDFINASVASYNWPSIGYHVADMSAPPHPYLETTLRLRDLIGDIPLLTAVRYTSLRDAEDALETGLVDMVGMMRAHIADPEIIRKTLDGRESDIRPCISSNFCIEQLATNHKITCMMNPRVGREAVWPQQAARSAEPRKVLVVGGGPAGLEAARVAAEHGHAVKLWEARQSLGGALNLAGTGVGRRDLHRMRDYLVGQLEKSGAVIETGRTASPDDIMALKPDLVVLASGAVPDQMPHPVFSDALELSEALAVPRQAWRDQSILVWDETGNWGALSIAETIAASGGAVSLMSQPDAPLWGINIYSRMTALERLRSGGVFVRTRIRPTRYADGMLTVEETSLGREEQFGRFDRIVLVRRGKAQSGFQQTLETAGIAVKSVGDAHAPRTLLQAVFEGNRAARQI